MRREYEFTFVTRADLPEADKTKLIAGYEEILARDGGEVVKKIDWGTKKLAYPIKKNFRGQYTFYDLVTTPANLAECERLIRIDDNVLRHLIINIGDDVDVEQRRAELAKAEIQKSEEK